MLAIERRNNIISLLETEMRVLVPDLAKKFNVTEETIRRDLEKLEKEGMLQKTYGGAVRIGPSSELPYRIRIDTNKAQKLKIAEKITQLIQPAENIMLDASSTCVHIARTLKGKDKPCTVITNSVEILMECSTSYSIKVISTGGVLRGPSLSLVGSGAAHVLGQLTADRAIISCKGLDFEKGIMESSLEEAEIKRAMAENCKELILAVDSSKFDRKAFAKTLDLWQVNMVVSDHVPEEWARFFEENNIQYM